MTTASEPAPEVVVLPQDVGIRLDGQERLRLVGAICRVQGAPVRYAFFPRTTTAGPAGASSTQPAAVHERYELKRMEGLEASITCDVTYVGLTAATITLSTTDALPDIQLLGVTPVRMLPCRILEGGAIERGPGADMTQAAIGPVTHGHINALFDPAANHAIEIDGQVEYELARNGTVLTISLPQPRGKMLMVLGITSHADCLHGMASTLGDGADLLTARYSAPAGWSGCRLGSESPDEDLLRIARWMAANMRPFGAVYVAANKMPLPDASGPTPNEDVLNAIDALGLKTATCRDDGTVELPRTRNLPETVIIEHLPMHDPREPGFEDYRRLRTVYGNLLCEYGPAGLACLLDPGPIAVAEPPGLEQVRLWASLVGLSGVVLMTEDRMDELPAERVEALRRVCPPAPIRAMDLSGRCGPTLPSIWDLRIATDGGRWDVVGVFNFRPEQVMKHLRIGELGIPTTAGTRFAVYEFWDEQLLAVTEDGCDVHLEADSCAVLCVRQLEADRPTLIGTSRHVTQGVMDLSDLRYDKEALTLSGRSALVADDPYELRVFVGEGEGSFEITGVDCSSATSFVRSAGPVQIVTLDSPRAVTLDWTIRLAKTSRDLTPPWAPRALSAAQNTRGVRLRWDARDERAVAQRVYRDQERIAEVSGRVRDFQDSDVVYGRRYEYAVSAVDYAGRESVRSEPVTHVTPIPGDTHLTQIVPLSVVYGHWPVNVNRSVEGSRLRIAGRRYFRGVGASPGTRVTYFLGRGYETFTGEVGIDDETQAKGSAVFDIYADDERSFSSGVMRGGQPARRFSVAVTGKQRLTLVVTDAGDGVDGDHADWGDTYLRVAGGPAPKAVSAPVLRPTSAPASTRPAATRQPASAPATRPGSPRVVIDTSLGAIVVELDADRTPVTVENFLKYVDEHFYDETIFHRAVKGFVIQGGGFTAELVQKPTRDPIQNESKLGRSNAPGTMAMARVRRPDSATSQFYINLGDNKRLDAYGGGYCVFGRVVEGLDIVERIGAVPTISRGGVFTHLPRDTVLIRSIRRQ